MNLISYIEIESQTYIEPKKPDIKEYAFLYMKYKTGKTNLC